MTDAKLRRYWFTFERLARASALNIGCGITAWHRDDALAILKTQVFAGGDIPPIKSVTEDINIRTLDPGHVIPNMGVVTQRGVWFPLQ